MHTSLLHRDARSVNSTFTVMLEYNLILNYSSTSIDYTSTLLIDTVTLPPPPPTPNTCSQSLIKILYFAEKWNNKLTVNKWKQHCCLALFLKPIKVNLLKPESSLDLLITDFSITARSITDACITCCFSYCTIKPTDTNLQTPLYQSWNIVVKVLSI